MPKFLYDNWPSDCQIIIYLITTLFQISYLQTFVLAVFSRSRCSQMLFKVVILKFSWISQENTCVGVSFLLKLVVFKACNFIKKRLQHRCFPVICEKFLRTLFSTEHYRWLLLLLHALRSHNLFVQSFMFVFLWRSVFINVTKTAQKRFKLLYKHTLHKQLL